MNNGGILGTFLTGLLAAETFGGLGLESSIGEQLVTQSIGILATVVWCGVISYILLKALDAVIGLRVSDEEETEGLDLVLRACEVAGWQRGVWPDLNPLSG